MPARRRCAWAAADPALATYHDLEWGHLPATERDAFELLTLEIFQGGLSWRTVLGRREGFRAAFAVFDPEQVARFGAEELERLASDARIVRHRQRIGATIENARRLLVARVEWGNGPRDRDAFVRRLALARDSGDAGTLAAEMQSRFVAVGPGTARSFLQAAGVVPPVHEAHCWLAPAPDGRCR